MCCTRACTQPCMCSKVEVEEQASGPRRSALSNLAATPNGGRGTMHKRRGTRPPRPRARPPGSQVLPVERVEGWARARGVVGVALRRHDLAEEGRAQVGGLRSRGAVVVVAVAARPSWPCGAERGRQWQTARTYGAAGRLCAVLSRPSSCHQPQQRALGSCPPPRPARKAPVPHPPPCPPACGSSSPSPCAASLQGRAESRRQGRQARGRRR